MFEELRNPWNKPHKFKKNHFLLTNPIKENKKTGKLGTKKNNFESFSDCLLIKKNQTARQVDLNRRKNNQFSV